MCFGTDKKTDTGTQKDENGRVINGPLDHYQSLSPGDRAGIASVPWVTPPEEKDGQGGSATKSPGTKSPLKRREGPLSIR